MDQSKKGEFPSPVNYNPNFRQVRDNTPVISFGHDSRSKEMSALKNNPGPGQYDPFKDKKRGFYIGQKLQNRLRENSPGPAVYSPKPDLTLRHNPNFKMDKA